MKCKLIKDCDGKNPDYDDDEAVAQSRLGIQYQTPASIKRPKGTEIEHPDCWMLVKQKLAVPMDEECAARSGVALVTPKA